MPRIPLLFLTDSPDTKTGLARIGRNLALRVDEHLGDIFRVGYLGRGGFGGEFPFPVWTIPHAEYAKESSGQWGSGILPQVWRDFARGEQGIVFTIWDAGRMLWLSQPQYLQDGAPVKDFLLAKPFKTWAYIPIDGHTPSGTLGLEANTSVKGFDRVLGYTRYGAKILETIRGEHVPFIYHGLEEQWFPRDRKLAREQMSWGEDDFAVGVVATNQARKDWGLAAQVGAMLKEQFGKRFRQWWHVDHMERVWNIYSLLDEFKLGDVTTVSNRESDDWLAHAYSACDATMAIGAGEGFGYPIVESIACGTPAVHGRYAGGRELCALGPMAQAWRLEGPANVQRPVYDPHAMYSSVMTTTISKMQDSADHLHWDKLWPVWEKWFREGACAS